MRRQNFKKQVLKRKNFLPTLLVTAFLWLIMSGLVYFVDPGIFLAIPVFFIFSFLTLLFTFSLIFADRRRGLLASGSLAFFMVLLYLGVGNIINFLLISGIAICIDLYYSAK